jgi:hypothetical protein
MNFKGLEFPNKALPIIVNICFLLFITLGIYATIKIKDNFRLIFLSSYKSNEDKIKIITDLANTNHWTLLENDTNYYKFQDPFKWTKWSNYISIIYDHNGFYINVLDGNWKPIDFGVSK